MGGKTQEERLILTEHITEQNAKAIADINDSLQTMTKLMAREDEKMRDAVNNLLRTADKCEARHADFIEKLNTKADALKDMNELIHTKASKVDFDELRKILRGMMFKVFWAITGTAGAFILGAVTYTMKQG